MVTSINCIIWKGVWVQVLWVLFGEANTRLASPVNLFGLFAMPKRRTKGVVGRSSLPPGYMHWRPEGYVPWAKPFMQGPDPGFGPWSPGYQQQMVPHQQQQVDGDGDDEPDDGESGSDAGESEQGSSSSLSSDKPKSSKHKKL